MKTETLKLVAEERLETGSQQSNRLRRNGWVPCVLYGTTMQPRLFKVNQHDLEMIVEHHSGENIIFELMVGGETIPHVLLKELQRDPITEHAVHIDFLKISMTQKLRVTVTVRLEGEPKGVAQQGGVLEHQARTVEVECLPGDMIKEFILDVSQMSVDDRLHVRDIKPDPKLTILTPGDMVIASVHMPRLEEEAKPQEATEEEGAEADVETREKAEESKPESADAEKGGKA